MGVVRSSRYWNPGAGITVTLLILGLPPAARAQMVISTDLTVSDSFIVTDPLVVVNGDDPILKLTDDRHLNWSGALVIGAAPGASGNVVVEQMSDLTLWGGGGVMDLFPDTDIPILDGVVYLGLQSGSAGTLTVSSSATVDSRIMQVGYLGNGDVTVESGGYVSLQDLVIGSKAGSVGDVLITGENSAVNTYWTSVAEEGEGYLQLIDGGYLYASYFYGAREDGSDAIIIVRGAGSHLDAFFAGIGQKGEGYMDISKGGLATIASAELGYEAGQTGTISVEDAGSLLVIDNLAAGVYGTGEIFVYKGAAVHLGGADLGGSTDGESQSVGRITVSDAGSSLVVSDFLTVGSYGIGELVVEDGGAATVQGYLYLGMGAAFDIYSSPSSGTMTVTGENSELSSQTTYIGYAGDGVLNVTSGGTVDSGTVYVASMPGSSGTIVVEGEDSFWSHGLLYLGSGGSADMEIKSGGFVSSTDAYVGNTSFATVTVTGGGSSWTTDDLEVGKYSTGTLSILAGGKVHSSNGAIGASFDSSGTVTVDGENSTWLAGQYLVVGKVGTGTLNITGGGAVTSTDAAIGTHSASSGIVNVSDTGSTWDIYSTLRIGDGGTGALHIFDGASVYAGTTSIGLNSIGLPTSSIYVSGTGSLFAANDIYVGYSGPGSLTIADGGTVSNIIYTSSLAVGSGSTGTAKVTGRGSYWNTYALNVGLSGTAELTIEDGGVVSAHVVTAGRVSGSQGSIAVTGIGSQLSIGGDMTIGWGGDGELEIASGGVVTTANAYLGTDEDSFGLVVVADPGSLLSITGNLILGNDSSMNSSIGYGIVTITDDSRVVVGGTTHLVESASLLNLDDGGTLLTSNLVIGGTLNWRGGTLGFDGTITGNLGVPEEGLLHGVGTITGNVTNAGMFSPGSSPGVVNIMGDFTQDATGTLVIELAGLLAGDDYDQLVIGGNATLGGTLDVLVLGGFTLADGMQFDIITVDGTLTGTFVGLGQDSLLASFGEVGLYVHYNYLEGASGVSLYTAVVPEPGSLTVVAIGCTLMLRRQRR